MVEGIFLSQQCEAVEVLMFVFHTHIAPVLSATRILHSFFPLHLLHYISDARMLWFHEHNFPISSINICENRYLEYSNGQCLINICRHTSFFVQKHSTIIVKKIIQSTLWTGIALIFNKARSLVELSTQI